MATPILVMVAGPNGSGKSTLTDALRADPGVSLPAAYINADDIQRSQGFDVVTAQRAAAELRARAMADRRDVMYETVMSHPSKLAELQRAKTVGYHVVVHFVGTEDSSINVQRVALRVSAGGHNVPEDRTRQRYGRTMVLAPIALGYAAEALVFDNSRRGAEGGLQLQAQLVGQRLELMTNKPARWVELLAARVNERAGELSRMQGGVRDHGLSLEHARLEGGQTQGPIGTPGQHYVIQQDLQSNALVVHDRSLLPADLHLEQGRSYRIGYLEGVSTLEAVNQAHQHVPPDAQSKHPRQRE